MYVISLSSASTHNTVFTISQDLIRCVVKITGDCIITSDISDACIVCDGSLTLEQQVSCATIYAKGGVHVKGSVIESSINSENFIDIDSKVHAQETQFSAVQVQLSEGAKLQQCEIITQPNAMANGGTMGVHRSGFFNSPGRLETPSPTWSSSDMLICSGSSDNQEGGYSHSESSGDSICELESSLRELLNSCDDADTSSKSETRPESRDGDSSDLEQDGLGIDDRNESGYAWT